jgi:hypothetical protein
VVSGRYRPVTAASKSPSVLKKFEGDISVKFFVSSVSSHEVRLVAIAVAHMKAHIIIFFIFCLS